MGTYESKVWQYERVLEAREGCRGKYGRIRLRSGGNHYRISPCDGTYPPCILEAYTVTILDDGHITPEALDKINDPLEAVDECALAWTHIACATVNGEAVDARVDDALDECQRVFLCWKQSYLRGYRDVRRKLASEGREDRTQKVGIREQGSTHSRMGRERFWTAAIKFDSRDIVYNYARRLHSEVGVGRADLKDEVRLFDRMTSEHSTLLFSIERNCP